MPELACFFSRFRPMYRAQECSPLTDRTIMCQKDNCNSGGKNGSAWFPFGDRVAGTDGEERDRRLCVTDDGRLCATDDGRL
jgi:hypothetical protein